MALNEIVLTLKGIKNTFRQLDEMFISMKDVVEYNNQFADLLTDVEGQLKTANRPFTIAVVGEFNVGKSTLLNALLRLSGEATLSSEETADTAVSTLIRYRDSGCPEARLHYFDGRPPEDVSWERAKCLTSQVYLNAHPDEKVLNRRLVEVEYFVDDDILLSLQFNDLPGTGSLYWEKHTKLTHKKMREADAILWIVGEEEPSAVGKHDLDVLADCAHTVIPIINVQENLSAVPPLEKDLAIVKEISGVLNREYRNYFSPDLSEPLCIAAKTIELEWAKKQPSEDILEEAGDGLLRNCLMDMFGKHEDHKTKGRLHRLCGNMMDIISRARGVMNSLLSDVLEEQTIYEGQISELEQKVNDSIDDIFFTVKSHIKIIAGEYADEVCEKVDKLASMFIDEVIRINNWADLCKSLTEKGRAQLQADFQRRFINDYLQLDRKDNWFAAVLNQFSDDVANIAIPKWKSLIRKLDTSGESGASVSPDIDFNRIADELRAGIVAILLRVLKVGALAGVLALIPGGQIIDAIGIIIFALVSCFTDPLESTRERATERASAQIKNQNYVIKNGFFKAGMEENQKLKDIVLTTLKVEQSNAEETMSRIKEVVRTVDMTEESLKNDEHLILEIYRG